MMMMIMMNWMIEKVFRKGKPENQQLPVQPAVNNLKMKATLIELSLLLEVLPEKHLNNLTT